MKKTSVSVLAMIIILSSAVPFALAEVKWRISNTLSFDQAPLDTAASVNGKWLFVLTAAGDVQIYKADGTLRDTISVGTHVDGIRIGAEENLLYLQSRDQKTVEVLFLDFIHDFDLSGSPVKGPPDAPVTIVEFSDFQCAYCSRLVELLDQVLAKNPDTVKLVFKHFPLSNHQFAVKAALAAMAAHEEGKFWPFHDLLFKNYNRLNDQKIEEITRELGFDPKAFDTKTKNKALLDQIKRDYRQGVDVGVRGTPTIYVNGQLVRDRSPDGIQAMIDAALKKAKDKS